MCLFARILSCTNLNFREFPSQWLLARSRGSERLGADSTLGVLGRIHDLSDGNKSCNSSRLSGSGLKAAKVKLRFFAGRQVSVSPVSGRLGQIASPTNRTSLASLHALR